MSRLTKHHLKVIREKLPHRYVNELAKRVNNVNQGTDKEKVSSSLVNAVMNDNREDYYGIIEEAINWGKELLRREKKIIKKAKTS